MADQTGMRPRKPVSMRPATQPLPTPLPPPPRLSQPPSPPTIVPSVRVVHTVPPEPHYLTRFPPINPADLETVDVALPVPRRSHFSPVVWLSLAVCAVLVCAIGWHEMRATEGTKWDRIKSFVDRWIAERIVPEEDLPYITDVPIVFRSSDETLARTRRAMTKEPARVLLGDRLNDGPLPADEESNQLR